MPEMFSAFLATFFANCLHYIVFIQAVGMMTFMSLIRKTIDKDSQDPRYAGIAAIVLSSLCLCIPFRFLINRQAQVASVLEDDTAYETKFTQFSSDYDKENPLTKKQGELRIIDLKIKQAQELGDNIEVSNLLQNRNIIA